MARNSRFDILFEPVRIGPVTAPNRFYVVPHASGLTNTVPRMRAGFRAAIADKASRFPPLSPSGVSCPHK
jgi:dimethylamine/trimethylamine dehydrogenase